MPSALESQAALRILTFNADQSTRALIAGLTGTPQQILAQLLEAVPWLISLFTDGSSALAADLFDDLRDLADTKKWFRAEPVVVDRTEKIRNAVAWAAQAPADGSNVTTATRLAEVVQNEVARPYRDTITLNSRRDPDSVGWARVAGDSCGFCRMLAGRGAVYKRDTAIFAAHGHCDCTARPAFRDDDGPEASVIQYLGSKRSKTPAQKARVRDYVATYFPD
jgi:hypothetical protein